MHLSDTNSGGDTDTLGPLPHMGTGPGWSSSDDQLSLTPYEGLQQHYYPPGPPPQYSQSPGMFITDLFISFIIICVLYSENRHNSDKNHSDSSGGSSASGTSRQTLREKDRNAHLHGSRMTQPSYNNQYHPRMKHSSSLSSSSEFTSVSQQQYHPQYASQSDRMSVQSMRVGGNMQQMPRDVSGSRASFQNALDNPCEYFIDVM